MRAFVTGVSGFVGSHVADRLGDCVGLVRDGRSSGWLDHALSAATLVRGDVRDERLLRRAFAEYAVDTVFHTAAVSVVASASRDPWGAFSTNVMGTAAVMEAARAAGVKKVVVLSTDKLFGEGLAKPPDAPYVVGEPYASSKVAQDILSASYALTYGMGVVRVRSCNAYGLDRSPRIVPNTVRAALAGASPLVFEGEATKRQYVYIADLVDALVQAASLPSGAVNVATDDVLTQEEVVRRILAVPGFEGLAPAYVRRERPLEIASQSLAPSDFGWNPKHGFDEGIRKTVELFRRYGPCP